MERQLLNIKINFFLTADPLRYYNRCLPLYTTVVK